jgi:hypothetical protein
MDDGGPVEVWTEGDRLVPPTYTQPESKARGDELCGRPKVFFRYPGDVIMELGDGPDGGAVFVSDKGTIRIDRGRCSSDPAGIVTEPIRDSDIHLARSDHHMRNWLDCVRSRQRPVADVEVGHRSATVCHLGNIARLLGRRLKWDPVREVFVGDDEANTYLDRPRRKPYQLPERV